VWSKYAPKESKMVDSRHLEKSKNLNPYVAIGGYFTPRRTFYPVALKPLGIVTKAY